jgi:murein DD-endopeptidase MepM/ murein hydrolase activator NlpD
VRQRLSSEPDRYRGRRRVPTPPRSRYAVVVTSAFVGAGIVALGAANMPDAKAVSPTVLDALENASVTANGLDDRAADAGRASRGDARGAAAVVKLPEKDAQADVWLLPLDDYTFTSPFGVRFGELHAGIDLAAPEGTPYKAVHAGVVKSAGYTGGYGYAVTVQHPDGTETIYGHSRRLLVKQGQHVKAGDVLGEVGNTGYTFGTHLHFEVHVKGDPNPVDPVPFMRKNGVDIKLAVESVYGGAGAS